MHRGALLLLVVTVLLLGAALLLIRGEAETVGAAQPIAAPRDGGREAPGRELPDRRGLPPSEVQSLEVAAHAELAAEAPDEPHAGEPAEVGRLTCRVTWAASGRPAVGERLVVRFAELEQSTEPPEALTDEDGRYTFTVDRPAKLLWIEVLSGPTTPRQRHREALDIALGEEAVVDFTLSAGGTLAGRVVNLAERPVVGATVSGWTSHPYELTDERRAEPEQTASTDGAGAFALSALGPPFALAAVAPGMATHTRVHGSVDEAVVTEGLTLVVSAERTLVGQVLGPGDVPLPDASVVVSAEIASGQERLTGLGDVYAWGPPGQRVRTGVDGRFQIGSLCQRTYRVEVLHADHPSWSGMHGPEDGELVVRLEAGSSLTGSVSSASAGPLAGAELRLGQADGAHAGMSSVPRATTDAAGRFAFHGLAPSEKAFLAVRAEGHAVHVEQPLVIPESGSQVVHLTLQPERRLAGVVTDTEGRPVDRAWVTIQGDRLVDFGNVTMTPKPTWETRFGPRGQRLDETGRFVFDELYDGLFRVEAVSFDETTRAVLEVHAGAEDLQLVLDPDAVVGLTLTGVARDGATGLPIQQTFFVTPMFAGGGGGFAGTSYTFEHPEGRYRITALEPGRLLLNASTAGHAPWSTGLLELDEGEHRFDIEFLPTRNVTFRVVDEAGEPVQLALTFEDQAGSSLMVESGPGSRNSRITTNTEGVAIAAGLPAARITVKAKQGWLGAAREYLVDLRSEPRGPVELVYGDPETATVLVLVLTGTPSAPVPDVWQPQPFASWVESEVGSGRLRPLPVPAEVSALDASGVIVARTTLDPAGAVDQALAVEGVHGAFVVQLELPGRQVVVAAEADGYLPASRTWTRAESTALEVVVLLMEPREPR